MFRNLIRNIGKPQPAPPRQDGAPPVYLMGVGSPLFNIFLPRIWSGLGGRAAGAVSDQHAGSRVQMGGTFLPVLSLAEFAEASSGRDVELVHFCADLDQYWALEAMPSPRMVVKDFLAMLYDLGLGHTYATMLDEQKWLEEHAGDLDEVSNWLGDERSRAILAARRSAILSADRRHLMRVAFDNQLEYYNRASTHASLVPRDDEIYVDVGAAHGDTVDKFVNLTSGRFEAIHAFEPTPGQFRQLRRRAEGDPRISAMQAAVGDSAGKLVFYDNPDNPFGGNALAGDGTPIEVDCVRLDDAVARCTLIKMDVEGYECNVLRGARRLVAECRPDMAITCYHYPQDLNNIIRLVREMHAYRNVALRHYSSCLYDSVLLFSDRQSFAA